nr:TonB-dependent receptor [Bacteroides sp. 51]
MLWFGLQLCAQQPPKKISVQLRDATLIEFIQFIERTTDYSFIYNEDVTIGDNITLNLNNKTLEEVLDEAFAYQPISYKISGKHILLQKAKPKPKPGSRKYTISGYITDRQSQETLIGANVFETRSSNGTTTNAYGFYTITLPEGETRIGFSYLGYDSQVCSFALRGDTVLNIRLSSDNRLEEVLILSDRVEAGLMSTHTGALDIPLSHIKNTPTILGEADVMKTIQLMPGVQSGVEGSAGLYIRGGSPDQNLILLDGAPVYSVDHVLGFFSIFTPEAVKKVTLFKGSFPARFGGRLSSVVDVRTNDGDMNTYHGTLSIGLLTSKLNLEGPIIKGKTSFNVSLRRSYLDLVTRPFMSDDNILGYYFYDINAKVNHKFSDKNRIYLSLYHGKDFFDSESKNEWGGSENTSWDNYNMDLQWGNTIASFRWNNIINNKLFSNTTISYNQYKMAANAKSELRYGTFDEKYRTNYNSGIRDWSAQIDFDYTPNPRHHIKFGGSYTNHSFKPEVVTTKISTVDEESKLDSTYNANSNSRIKAWELSAYMEDNVDLTPRLRANVGLHLSSFHVQGKSYFSVQPRLSARYQLDKDVILKASYSQMNQHINLLTSAPISMPTDLWVPVTRNLKPMLSRQYALGTYYTGAKGWEFSVEGYYKDMDNILEYKDATRFIGSSASWEEKVEMGKGRSFGVEFMAQRTVGKTTGWLNYTLAKSDRKFAKGGINNGERFPYKYDRRHHVNLVVNHKFNDRIDVSGSWFFASGATTTIAREVTGAIRPHTPGWAPIETSDPEVIKEQEYVEHRNNFRLPPSHRLNVGINFHKKTKHGMRTWNVSLYNVYNAMTPTFVHRSYRPVTIYNEGANEVVYRPVLKKLTLLPCIPSVTYTYKF